MPVYNRGYLSPNRVLWGFEFRYYSVFKVTAMDMIQSIREAFNELLNENHWMDDQTRIVAKAKADAMKERIGYPEFLTDPDELEKEYVMVGVFF